MLASWRLKVFESGHKMRKKMKSLSLLWNLECERRLKAGVKDLIESRAITIGGPA